MNETLLIVLICICWLGFGYFFVELAGDESTKNSAPKRIAGLLLWPLIVILKIIAG